MNISPQAMERLARQHEKYLDSLGAKKLRIQDCWKTIQSGGWTQDRLSTLRTAVHRLSGSAGSYGLNDLGKAAQDLDRTLAMEAEMSSMSESINDLLTVLMNAFDEAIVLRSGNQSKVH